VDVVPEHIPAAICAEVPGRRAADLRAEPPSSAARVGNLLKSWSYTQPKPKGQYEKENYYVMAVIQSNTGVLCLMALLMISTTLLSIQASGNIGLEANTGAVRSEANAGTEKNREPYLPPPCDPKYCDEACKDDKHKVMP
jgi:hypothetical protein